MAPSSSEFDTIIWATGFKTSLPFLDTSLLTFEQHHPLRVGGLTVPVGLERLYLIGMAAPRGPQLPVYSAQAELVTEFLRLHDQDPAFALSAHLAARQAPDSRIDILRYLWQKQLDQTHREVSRLLRDHPAPTQTQGADTVPATMEPGHVRPADAWSAPLS